MALFIFVGWVAFISCGDEGDKIPQMLSDDDGMEKGGKVDDKEEGEVEADDKGDDKRGALPGLPGDVAGYEKWLKLNAQLIPPSGGGDPHNGTKNVYANQARATIAPNGQQKFPYPDGCIIVKESTRPGANFIGLIAIMRKAKGSDPAHNDWTFVEYTRGGADDAFREVAKGAACWDCHSGAANTDYVYTRLE